MIEFPIPSSEQTLVLTEHVIKYIMRHRQAAPNSREAGGQLFARFDANTIRIEKATGPRPADFRSRMAFIPHRLAERREIKRLFKEGLHFVGDWHTHPEFRPTPSRTDIDSFSNMFRQSRHRLAGFVMIIAGTEPTLEGLFVAVVDDQNWYELRPLPIPKVSGSGLITGAPSMDSD